MLSLDTAASIRRLGEEKYLDTAPRTRGERYTSVELLADRVDWRPRLLNDVLPEGWEFSPTAEAAALRASWWRTDVSRRSFQHTRHDMHMVAPLLYAFFPIELSERSYTLACSLL